MSVLTVLPMIRQHPRMAAASVTRPLQQEGGRRRADALVAEQKQVPPMSASGEIAASGAARSDSHGVAPDERFRRLVMPHLDAAFTLARYLARDHDVAQDLVQDSFLRALRSFGTFRGEDARPWLLAIVRNRFRTWAMLRRTDRTIPLEGRDGSDSEADLAAVPDPDQEDPEAALMRRDDTTTLRDLIEALPPVFREVIVLREIEELSYQQIATVTGCPIGTVMSRLARARQMLQRSWRSLSQDREDG
jgi:RNA polymerase sigma factor (sigma-70 family)